MIRRVLVVKHVPWEGPGRIAEALRRAEVGYGVRTLIAEPQPIVPRLDDLAGVVVLGGPMGADDVDRHPSLALERDLLRRAVDADLPVLGVCLGHQLLARALGGELHPAATHELGVAPVELLADSELGAAGQSLDVLHWHNDNVDAPAGAVVLARSDGCPNQAFRIGSAVGTQFHLEVSPATLDTWLAVEAVREELGGDGAELRAALAAADERMRAAADALFDGFAARAASRT